jgi:hypothetical protein
MSLSRPQSLRYHQLAVNYQPNSRRRIILASINNGCRRLFFRQLGARLRVVGMVILAKLRTRSEQAPKVFSAACRLDKVEVPRHRDDA